MSVCCFVKGTTVWQNIEHSFVSAKIKGVHILTSCVFWFLLWTLAVTSVFDKRNWGLWSTHNTELWWTAYITYTPYIYPALMLTTHCSKVWYVNVIKCLEICVGPIHIDPALMPRVCWIPSRTYKDFVRAVWMFAALCTQPELTPGPAEFLHSSIYVFCPLC